MNEQTYYYFVNSKYAIENIEKKRIKVSLINELNDPFELLPYLRYPVFEKREKYQNIRKKVSKKYGLLCFSKKWDEPLLWGHYADKHKGIALGFEILKDDVLKIEYQSEPLRQEFDLTNDEIANKQLFLDLAKVKYKNWAYEEEYRLLIKLEDCIHNNHYFLRFKNRLFLKEIVLGCKFNNKKERKKLKELADNIGAKIIATRQGWEDYKIHPCGTKNKELSKISR